GRRPFRRARRPALVFAERTPRGVRAAVLPQAARLRARPRGATVGRAALGRYGNRAEDDRLPGRPRRRNDRPQPPVPRDPRARDGLRRLTPETFQRPERPMTTHRFSRRTMLRW